MGFHKRLLIFYAVYQCSTVSRQVCNGIFIVFGYQPEDDRKVSSIVGLQHYYEVKNVVTLDQGLIKQRRTGKDFKETSK